MENLWSDQEATKYKDDPLALRVYSSRLIGRDTNLVLHGGGNTSVKITENDLFDEPQDILYVKGSGWDLVSIEAAGFAPVKLETLIKMSRLDSLSDTDMVRFQRAAMTNPNAPNPSVEAILHAIIPYKFVDHSHADSVVTISNSKDGFEKIKEIYSDKMIIVPYVMPGFILAKAIARQTKSLTWEDYEGMILLNHGVFTFDNDAKKSYDKMIDTVSMAEDYLKNHKAEIPGVSIKKSPGIDILKLAKLRHEVSKIGNQSVIARLNDQSEQIDFSNLEDLVSISQRGPITPDHIIRTKRTPLIVTDDPAKDVKNFSQKYLEYFSEFSNGKQTCLTPDPKWAVWPGCGIISFGKSFKDANIINDISEHTVLAIQKGEKLGGWVALPKKDLFEMEYWELEQAKLKKSTSTPEFQGKVALVTGAASGIGKSIVESLNQKGCAVIALDISEKIESTFDKTDIIGLTCDITNVESIKSALQIAICTFGGIDIVISNAGIFTSGQYIENMGTENWDKNLSVNLTGHKNILKETIGFLSLALNPSILLIASRNVAAPGPGAGAYSVAKAGLTQLGRVAALELGEKKINVNVIHPNQVFDTAIWTNDVLEQRAQNYGLTVEEYKTNNILKTEITSKNVAELACAMVGPIFSKTTGAQIPIDGGNDRVV